MREGITLSTSLLQVSHSDRCPLFMKFHLQLQLLLIIPMITKPAITAMKAGRNPTNMLNMRPKIIIIKISIIFSPV